MNKGQIRKVTKRIISMLLVAVLLVLSIPEQFLQTYATTKSQWQEINVPSTDMVAGAFGNHTFLIMDYYGKIYGSNDGAQWEEYAQIDVSEYNISGAELAYCGEYFYIYGNEGEFLYSEDGKTWNSVDMGSYQIVNIVQNEGRYYAVSEIRVVDSGNFYTVKDSKVLYSDNGYEWQEFDTEVDTTWYIDVQCGKDNLALSVYDKAKQAIIIYTLDYQGIIQNSQEFALTNLPLDEEGRIYYVDDCFVTWTYASAYCLNEEGTWQENEQLTEKLCDGFSEKEYLDDYIIALNDDEMYTCFDVKEDLGTWYYETLPLNYVNGFIYGDGKAIVFSSDTMAMKTWNAAQEADGYNAPELPDETVSGNDTVSGNQPGDNQSIPSKLTEDLVISGDVELDGQNIDLNGYSLTIQGNLIHTSGTIQLNGGTLTIEGDYRMQDVDEAGDYCVSNGLLVMQNETDYLHIKGNFYNATTADERGYLTNGVIEAEGDLLVLQGAGTYAFASGQNQTVKLSGTQKQQVGAQSAEIQFTMANVEITNSSETGVVFQNDPLILKEVNDNGKNVGGRIAIGASTTFTNNQYHGSVITIENMIIEQPWHISGDLTTDSYVRVKEELTVDGSLVIQTEYVECCQGQILVGGDLEATKEFGGQGLVMSHEDDLVRVAGDFIYEIENENTVLQGGTIETGGDVHITQGYLPGEAHKFVLNGTKLQKLYVDTGISFTTVEVKNQSEEGIWSSTVINADEMILNGCRVIYGEGNTNGVMGYTLTQDEVVEGDFYLMDGTLDLNGYTLTITGDLIQASGIVDINGGTLVVEGDYRLQFLENGEEKNPGYGILKMTEESDYVTVKGDFVITSASSLNGYLTERTLELRGDFTQSGADNFIATQNHNTYFTGIVDEEGNKVTQTATFKSTTSNVRFQNLLLNYDFKDYYKFLKLRT